MNQPIARQPATLHEEATKDDEKIWNEKLNIYAKKTDALEQNLIAVNTIIWGQASPTMQIKVKSVNYYEAKPGAHDCLWLLQLIK